MDALPPQCIGWIEAIFGECVTTQRQAWSLMLGYTSIFCWLNAQIPQIIENFKLSSAGEDLEDNREDGAEDLDPNETMSPLLPRPRPRRATTAADIAHRRSTSMVLFGLVLFTMRQTMPGLEQSGAGILSYNRGADNTYSGRAFSKRGLDDSYPTMGEEPAPTDPNAVQLGRIFAWVCTVFYLSSRMPQLWKNFTRKSVQGLSILMFFWAAMGNLSYTLSILNSKDAVDPETGRKFLLEAVPYVLGSSGTLMFDLSIFFQWLYYTGRLRVLGLRPKRHHHHHRRHHSRSTVGRSRSQSGVNSMILSPSESQSGLYNILVDEEDPDVIENSNAKTPQVGSDGGLSPFQDEMGPLDHEPQQHQRQQGHGSDTRSPLL
ncbi:hypothetical protein KI688_012300 [Linnemannia hyalina]|uniref:PQ-loop-domain-containing protein n=1 Tax=Linnemannia hyalina TaxID=64524 RepID=A0A9P7XUT1_9FUNG|nr:hypothetical protein KI688_012300 [Linnemannia hyalina]